MADMTARSAPPPEMEDRPTKAATITISLRPTDMRLTRRNALTRLMSRLRRDGR